MRQTNACLAGLLVAALLAGCAYTQPKMPTSRLEYERMAPSDRERFPRQTVIDYNIQRALNQNLAPERRVNSLRLVTQLSVESPELDYQVAAVLSDPGAGPQLRRVALEFLLSRDHPGLAEYVVKLLPHLKAHSELRDRIFDWLIKHPQPQVLAEVVKLWASEPSATSPNEPRFRRIVERMTNKYWDEALLDAINSEGFFARGSAIEVLTSRTPVSIVRMRVARVTARTDAMRAMKEFLTRFDYLPTTASQLLQTAWLYTQNSELLGDASRLARQWETSSGYRFNVRDLHLLSRLATDPLRANWSRSQLVSHLSRILSGASHVSHRPSVRGAVDDYTEDFAKQAGSLSMADLWNIYLLREMLSRRRVQMALRVTAQRDRDDNRSAWGGLVFYQNGQAEAILYPYSATGGQNDLVYAPGRQAVTDSRDALCRFQCHFEKLLNSKRAGPGPEELRQASRNNYYGLVITSVSEHTFCAHYYNPEGVVVSLGTIPFR